MATTEKLAAPALVGGPVLGKAARAASAALGLVLLPKCPMCIAAYLVSFGLGTSAAAWAAPLVRPLGWLLAATAAAALAYSWWRRAPSALTKTKTKNWLNQLC